MADTLISQKCPHEEIFRIPSGLLGICCLAVLPGLQIKLAECIGACQQLVEDSIMHTGLTGPYTSLAQGCLILQAQCPVARMTMHRENRWGSLPGLLRMGDSIKAQIEWYCPSSNAPVGPQIEMLKSMVSRQKSRIRSENSTDLIIIYIHGHCCQTRL